MKHTRLIKTLLISGLIALLLLCSGAFAAEGTVVASGVCGENLSWALDSEGTMTISGTGAMYGSASASGYSSYRASIKNLVIEDGVTSIGWESFNNCTSLESIRIPESLISIGTSAFNNCTSLKNVYAESLEAWIGITFGTVGSNVTDPSSNPMYYASNLFFNNELAENITIPEGTTSISDYAFCGCTSLKSVIIPDSVISIGQYAFYNCTGLTEVSLPENLTEIKSRLFSYCSILGSIAIPPKVTSISDYAFSSCSKLTSIEIPNSVTSIGEFAFYFCKYLSSVSLPITVTDIGDSAFLSCNRNLEISCHKDSAAYNYAISNNYAIRPEYHSYQKTSEVNPQCEAEGWAEYICSICSHSYTEEYEALGHNYEISSHTDAACTTTGNTTYACSRCGDSFSEDHASLGHDYQISLHISANCEHAGYTHYICSRCGDSYSEIEHPWRHSYIDGICINCGEPKPIPSMSSYFRTEILKTGYSVCLPKGSYRRAESSSSTDEYWVLPGKQVVRFKRHTMYAPVSDWATAGASTYGTKYTSINEIPVAFGTKYDSSSGYYAGMCFFNTGGYTYIVEGEKMSSSQKTVFTNICNMLYNDSFPEQSSFRQEILDSGLSVYMPGDAYLYSKSADALYFSIPRENLLVGFMKNQLAPLETWHSVLAPDFDYAVIEEIGGIPVLVCIALDENERYSQLCYVNGPDATYTIASTDMNLDQQLWFDVNISGSIEAIPNPSSSMLLPASLKEIRQEAFAGGNAQAVVIPDGCTAINKLAFSGCKSLVRIDVPASVTKIAPDAFKGCSRLVVYAPVGSEAIRFAKMNGITCIQK